MVTVFLRGGLGNQMFQYAAGLNLAKAKGSPLILDTTFLNDRFPRKEFTYRTYDMDVFTLTPKFTRFSKISERFPIPGFWLGLDFALMKAQAVLGVQNIIVEKDDAPVEVLTPLNNRDIVLYGRWQNERYFAAVKDGVRAAFQFRHPFNEEALRIAQKIVATNSIALCVRRGDYVAFASTKRMMGETNANYYSEAIQYMNEHIKDPRYVVFSDDLEWCKANVDLPSGTLFVGKMGPKWSFHLQLMSLCKHSIITNSTFYWWGAWLNANPDKIVVAPRKWYADGRDDKNEIVPEEWIKM